jgi:hypothetical protein
MNKEQCWALLPARGGGDAPAGQSLWGRGSPERPVINEVAGSSRLDVILRRRQDPEDGCNSDRGLWLLGGRRV